MPHLKQYKCVEFACVLVWVCATIVRRMEERTKWTYTVSMHSGLVPKKAIFIYGLHANSIFHFATTFEQINLSAPHLVGQLKMRKNVFFWSSMQAMKTNVYLANGELSIFWTGLIPSYNISKPRILHSHTGNLFDWHR